MAAALLLGVARGLVSRAPDPPGSLAAVLAEGPVPLRLAGRVTAAADEPGTDGSASPDLPVEVAAHALLPSARSRVPVAGGAQVICAGGALPGDEVEVVGLARAPPAATNPGQRDRREDLRARGIHATMDARGPGSLRVVGNAPPWHPGGIAWRLRAVVLDRIRAATRGEGRALLEALLLGRRDGLDPDLVRGLRRTGTWHVLVVSGIHVALAAGAVVWVLRRIGSRRWAALLSLPVVAAYAAASGMGFPVRRAALAAALVAAAPLLRRTVDPIHILAVAAAAETCARPAAPEEPGFQLTVLAVLGILRLARGIGDVLHRRRRLLLRFRIPAADRSLRRLAGDAMERLLPPALAAWSATAPVIAARFGQVALLAPVANLVVVPLALATLLAAPVILLVGAVAPGLSAPLADGAAVAIRDVTSLLERIPGGSPTLPPPGLPGLALPCGILAWAALRGGPRGRWGLAAVLAPPLLLALPALRGPVSRPAELLILDTGHGMSVLAVAGEGRALIDAGGRSPAVTASRVLPALRAEGVDRLEVLVVSHEDSDHAGGAADVLGSLPVGALVVAEGFGEAPAARTALAAAARRGVPVLRVAAGDRVHLPGALLEILHPPAGDPGAGRENDGSLVVRWRAGRASALLPGDAEDPALLALLRSDADLRTRAMLLPHHGGAGVTLAPLFAAATGAGVVVASDGPTTRAHRSVGAPAAPVYRSTLREGAIRLRP